MITNYKKPFVVIETIDSFSFAYLLANETEALIFSVAL